MNTPRKVEPRRRDFGAADALLLDRARPGDWHIVETNERRERLVRELLRDRGFNVYLPMIPVRRKKNRRTIERLEPLLLGYVFVQFDRRVHRWRPILSTLGVRSLLSFDRRSPAIVPAAQLEALDDEVVRQRKDFEDRRRGRKANHSFKPGDRVRLKDGAYQSFIALLDKADGDDLEIRLAFFGRAVLCTVSHERVELVDASP